MAIKQIIQVVKAALRELKSNDPLRLAAATAFFTTFALPAILIIFIQLFGLVLNPQALSDHLFEHLAVILGESSVSQVKQTLVGFTNVASNIYIAVGGFIFLMFVATTLFKVIRDSLNQLWNIKVYSGRGIRFKLQARLKAMGIIMSAGILFLASLVAEAVQALLLDYINELWRGSGSGLYLVLNQLLSTIIVTTWFTVLFRFLANGHPTWKVALAGGMVTGVLFTIGKLILGYLLGYSNIHTIYGASGSFVLILLFVFYASFILYFGATFTHAWAEYTHRPIVPGKNAFKYELSEIKKQ